MKFLSKIRKIFFSISILILVVLSFNVLLSQQEDANEITSPPASQYSTEPTESTLPSEKPSNLESKQDEVGQEAPIEQNNVLDNKVPKKSKKEHRPPPPSEWQQNLGTRKNNGAKGLKNLEIETTKNNLPQAELGESNLGNIGENRGEGIIEYLPNVAVIYLKNYTSVTEHVPSNLFDDRADNKGSDAENNMMASKDNKSFKGATNDKEVNDFINGKWKQGLLGNKTFVNGMILVVLMLGLAVYRIRKGGIN